MRRIALIVLGVLVISTTILAQTTAIPSDSLMP